MVTLKFMLLIIQGANLQNHTHTLSVASLRRIAFGLGEWCLSLGVEIICSVFNGGTLQLLFDEIEGARESHKKALLRG